MAKFQLRDFYFGACLFSFFKHNNDAVPSIIEHTKDTQVIKMTTNTSKDFYIIMKYTKDYKETKNVYRSWSFKFTEKQHSIIEKYHDVCENVYFFFICGETQLSNTPKKINDNDCYIEEIKGGEVAIFRYCDYLKVKDKETITINIIDKGSKYFNLHVEQSRNCVIRSKRNNIEQKITDIELN